MEQWPVAAPESDDEALALAGIDVFRAAKPALTVVAVRRTVVVLSRSRDPGREVYLDLCRTDGVPVVVRPSGGGAVVLAPGTVAATLLTRATGLRATPEACFSRYCRAIARAFEDCGVPGAVMRGISDLCFGARKVAGTSLRIARGNVLFQAAVLVDADLELIHRYLPMPSREPDYRGARSHRDFLTTLRAQGFAGGIEEVVTAVRARLREELEPNFAGLAG